MKKRVWGQNAPAAVGGSPHVILGREPIGVNGDPRIGIDRPRRSRAVMRMCERPLALRRDLQRKDGALTEESVFDSSERAEKTGLDGDRVCFKREETELSLTCKFKFLFYSQ